MVALGDGRGPGERAAVDHEGVTGDPRRPGTGEEPGRVRDVVGLAEPTQGQACGDHSPRPARRARRWAATNR